MEKIYTDYLLSKRILVSDVDKQVDSNETVALALFCLYNEYGVVVTRGKELVTAAATQKLIEQLNERVPDAFYRNYPMSVLSMTPNQLLIDQLVHYAITYGLNEVDEAGHSIFEENLMDRAPLRDDDLAVSYWSILTEEQAHNTIKVCVMDLLKGSRPLNSNQEELVLAVYNDNTFDNNEIFNVIKSKNIAIRMLLLTRDWTFTKFLSLADVIKVVEELLVTDYYHRTYGEKVPSIKKLNLKNKDRKFITQILDRILERKNVEFSDCYEKKQIWCGLLHHIHYIAKTAEGQEFVNAMRNRGNQSVFAYTESYLEQGYPVTAAKYLVARKSSGALIRNLNYILSRCISLDQASRVINSLGSDFNVVAAIQLYEKYKYMTDSQDEQRTFSFVKYKLNRVHKETTEEVKHRKSYVPKIIRNSVTDQLLKMIKEKLANTIDKKIYIDPAMSHYALPINESTGNTGIGYMTIGSRIPLGGKNIRAFTYWEKVNDIDLACFALNNDGTRNEFSWRTMRNNQSNAVTYSGDQTSGYNGGSEFFDINITEFKKLYPTANYIVFTNNVFSDKNFSETICTAGFMLRKDLMAGKIFEPKTVATSYKISADSTFAYLFAIDLKTNEMIWLNQSVDTRLHVGASAEMSQLEKSFNICKTFNVYNFFSWCAVPEMIVEKPEEAEIIVSDRVEGDNVIHGCDMEKILPYMNI